MIWALVSGGIGIAALIARSIRRKRAQKAADVLEGMGVIVNALPRK